MSKISKKFHQYIRNLTGKLLFDERLMMKNIFEFCQNEMLLRQGMDFSGDERYRFYKDIHKLLKIMKVQDPEFHLCRVGKYDDGGYVMASWGAQRYSGEKTAYSIGICDDVSWDLEMAEAGYQIYQYDHTIRKLPCRNKAFHWKRIGLTGGEETSELKNLKTLLRENGHEEMTGAVLKMDIEGYEWDVLKNCESDDLNKFDQILMELHNFHNLSNKKLIVEALKRLNKTHQIVHLHANNISPVGYRGDCIMPNCLEVVYVKRTLCEFNECEFYSPTMLDRPNLDRIPEITLGIW